ncbi:uncharacterized protein LOC119552547 [Drosophila subpulchrella]|uniref:uncharacterized protein LOC119552547 n=1 Tax=Drosophila subpulchrella TaxID=1486046 RepID=UPI0018A158D5|nr:uncharacterized protein LOC119552547 [Drosophila subpulchrella]
MTNIQQEQQQQQQRQQQLLHMSYCIVAGVVMIYLRIEEFYGKSFVPDHMHVTYDIVNFEEINVNLTVTIPFPGKLLMHIFARKLSNQVGGSDQTDLVRLRNLDLCKLLDSLRNITVEEIQGESLLPTTFVISCPLVPGFYFVRNGIIDSKLVPFRIPDGRYVVLLELIQVYEEVIKVVSCRIKFAMKTPPGYEEPSVFESSEEKDEATQQSKVEKEESSSEVFQPSEDNYEKSIN